MKEPCFTPRQREVLQLVGDGLSNKGIAERLGISVNTASNILKTAYEQLGLSNMKQYDRRVLAAFWVWHNWKQSKRGKP